MSKAKIMIIDDEEDMTTMTRMRLEQEGYEVVVVNSSPNAIEAIKAEKPDLLLLDVMMPYIDGYQLKDEIRDDPDIKQMPIIIFTAKQSEDEIIDDSRLFHSVDDYILKPYMPDNLIEKIQKLLNR